MRECERVPLGLCEATGCLKAPPLFLPRLVPIYNTRTTKSATDLGVTIQNPALSLSSRRIYTKVPSPL